MPRRAKTTVVCELFIDTVTVDPNTRERTRTASVKHSESVERRVIYSRPNGPCFVRDGNGRTHDTYLRDDGQLCYRANVTRIEQCSVPDFSGVTSITVGLGG